MTVKRPLFSDMFRKALKKHIAGSTNGKVAGLISRRGAGSSPAPAISECGPKAGQSAFRPCGSTPLIAPAAAGNGEQAVMRRTKGCGFESRHSE